MAAGVTIVEMTWIHQGICSNHRLRNFLLYVTIIAVIKIRIMLLLLLLLVSLLILNLLILHLLNLTNLNEILRKSLWLSLYQRQLIF